MDNLEKVEKIREKTGVSYEEAKEALEASEYDVLDAIVYLEKNGKVNAPEKTVVVVDNVNKSENEKFKKTQDDYKKKCRKRFGDYVADFAKWLVNIFKKSIRTSFVVERKHEVIISMPVLVFLILLFVLFWLVCPLIIIGLFADCHYRFDGAKEARFDINDFCDKCSKGAEDLKNSFTSDDEER